MSQKRVLETIMQLGFTEKDSEVYIFLAKKGPRKAQEIINSRKINKAQLYRSLKKLQSRGLVDATLEYPAYFSAVSFDRVLELFIKAKKDEVREVEENKDSTLALWKSLTLPETVNSADKFMVLEGNNFIFSKIAQMIKGAKNEILFLTDGSGFIQAEKADIISCLVDQKVSFKILTNVTSKNVPVITGAFGKKEIRGCLRHLDEAEKVFPMFFVIDGAEVVFSVSAPTENTSDALQTTGLWTNNAALIDASRMFFEKQWIESVDFQKKIAEIETGNPAPETRLIRDGEMAFKKYRDLLGSVEKEAIIMTSAQCLVRMADDKALFKTWRERKVFVRIMAPITDETKKIVSQLSKFCEIRNLTGYLSVAIVDGKDLFNFKMPLEGDDPSTDHLTYFESSIYTNDPEYVRGRKQLLEYLWSHNSA